VCEARAGRREFFPAGAVSACGSKAVALGAGVHFSRTARCHPLRPGLRAFTLIELLVVLVIIAVLAGFGFKLAADARKKSNKITSLNNLRQWGKALAASMADSDGQLPSDGAASGAVDMQSADAWFNRLPRYISERALNDPAITSNPPSPGQKSVWINPAVPVSVGKKFVNPPSSFLFCYAMNDYLSNQENPTIKNSRVANHTATVFMGETADDQPVLKPGRIKAYFGSGNVDTDPANEANFLFCDGHVGTFRRSEFSKSTATDDQELDPNFTFIPYVGATP
jgi:prepilin-type N-terminal cleavage/methylation domain-containing protein/prepilin-type processing-associated H-X9-DG protein